MKLKVSCDCTIVSLSLYYVVYARSVYFILWLFVQG